jgi:glucoamylase
MRSQTGDHGKLPNGSAMVFKALEDKTHPGALIASLSTPFGEEVNTEVRNVGYRAVWPRDLY